MIEWLFFPHQFTFKFFKWEKKREKKGGWDVLALTNVKWTVTAWIFRYSWSEGRGSVGTAWAREFGRNKRGKERQAGIKASEIGFRDIQKSSSLQFFVSFICLWYQFLRSSIITTNHLALKNQKFQKILEDRISVSRYQQALLCLKAVGKNLVASSSF